MNLLLDARRPLLEGVLDYRASLGQNTQSLETAVTAYRKARASSTDWAVGRFLCATSGLEHLAAILTAELQPGDRPWHIGAVADESIGTAAMHASVLDTYLGPAGSVASLETMASDGSSQSATSLAIAASGISATTTAFVNIDPSSGDSQVAHLADVSRGRLHPVGGLVGTTTHPAPLAAIIRASIEHGLALRMTSPSSPDSDFMNVLAATALAYRGASVEQMVAVLSDDEPSALRATAVGVRWRDQLFGAADIKKARTTLLGWECADLATTFEAFAAAGVLAG